MGIRRHWYLGNDMTVTLSGFQNALTGDYLNNATVSCRLLETDGTEVLGSQSLQYVAASNGNYRFTVDKDAVALVDGQFYILEIVASETGIDAQWEVLVQASRRS